MTCNEEKKIATETNDVFSGISDLNRNSLQHIELGCIQQTYTTHTHAHTQIQTHCILLAQHNLIYNTISALKHLA